MTLKNANLGDSRPLQLLRLDCDREKRWEGKQITPYRLGIYAGERAIDITDFGTHSRRWRELFTRGFSWGFRHPQGPNASGTLEPSTSEEALRAGVVDPGIHARAKDFDARLSNPRH